MTQVCFGPATAVALVPAGEPVQDATPLATVLYLQQLTAQLQAGDPQAVSFVREELAPSYIAAAMRAAAATSLPLQEVQVGPTTGPKLPGMPACMQFRTTRQNT